MSDVICLAGSIEAEVDEETGVLDPISDLHFAWIVVAATCNVTGNSARMTIMADAPWK